MLVVGLTGGIASGKTLVSDAFSALGVWVIDADSLAREVVMPGSKGLEALVELFSETILRGDGELDRRKLRQLIFDNAEYRQQVEHLLHPRIRALSDARIDSARQAGHAYVICAIPLLVETSQQDRFDRILVVDVPKPLQIQRLMARDRSTLDEAQAILTAQASRDQRLAIAHDVIVNDGKPDAAQAQVQPLHEYYLQLSAIDSDGQSS